jgi:hypothetical protein
MPLQPATVIRLERENEDADTWQCYVDYDKIASGGLFLQSVQNIPISHGYME